MWHNETEVDDCQEKAVAEEEEKVQEVFSFEPVCTA